MIMVLEQAGELVTGAWFDPGRISSNYVTSSSDTGSERLRVAITPFDLSFAEVLLPPVGAVDVA